MKNYWIAAGTAALAMHAVTTVAAAAACSAESGRHTAALVELYTSEGCSSCPPADSWLRSLRAQGFAADRVVPLALHVDYWDYIGWKDPFARPLYSARQREAATQNRKTFVYTPQVVLGGRDFQRWGKGAGFADEVARVNAAPPRAGIRLEMHPAADGRLAIEARATVSEAAQRAGTALYLSYYQNDLATAVHAGENKGATLRHEFVSREWSGPVAIATDGTARAQLNLLPAPAAKAANIGAVAFVQNRATGEVLQALALPACGG